MPAKTSSILAERSPVMGFPSSRALSGLRRAIHPPAVGVVEASDFSGHGPGSSPPGSASCSSDPPLQGDQRLAERAGSSILEHQALRGQGTCHESLILLDADLDPPQGLYPAG